MENHDLRTRDVVVIGAGLTGLTTAFYARKRGRDVEIVEQADRIGGQIRTHRVGDFIFESGPNTGVVSCPEVAELFNDLCPHCELEPARASSKRRLIWKDGRFHPLPSGIGNALTTPLFTWNDKLRILGEPWRRKGTDPDESVGALAARRLGQSYLDYAVDPFISGVYAGDPMALPTRLALPKLYHLEQTYGSFIRGAIAKARQPKTERDRLATKQVFSARGGLQHLVNALGQAIKPEHISLGAKNVDIRPEEDHFCVQFTADNGRMQVIRCAKVVTTCGAYALPRLLPFIDEAQLTAISTLKYASIVQIGVGIARVAGPRYAAFGGLVPSREQQNVLGILFPSACFEGRSPADGAVFSFFIGGVHHPAYIEMSDDRLQTIAEEALHTMLKYPADTPIDAIRIYRHPQAIPQYELTTDARLASINAVQHHFPGLIIAGSLRDGIGMAHRIKQGTDIGTSI